MEIVLRHIEYLLCTHDCVIVPNLGAFIAHKSSAKFDSEKGLFISPQRIYTFNSALSASDGILTNSISRSLGISFEKASLIVTEAVQQIHEELKTTGEFVFGRIGRLELSLLGELNFVTYQADKLTPLANWIGAIAPDVAIKKEKLVEKVQVDVETLRPQKFSRFKKFVRTGIGAVAAILLALIVSTPLSDNNIPTYSASTVPPVTLKENKDIIISHSNIAESEEEKSFDEALIIETDTNALEETESLVVNESIEPENNTITVSKQPSRQIRFEDSDPYILVVATFNDHCEAEQFVESYKLQGVQLGMVSFNDSYRIYAATGYTGDQTMSQADISKISTHFKNAWVACR